MDGRTARNYLAQGETLFGKQNRMARASFHFTHCQVLGLIYNNQGFGIVESTLFDFAGINIFNNVV